MLLLSGLAAAWMNMGTLHFQADADSLVLVLVSLQRWTPFYWEQNRFGMLVPLIALPIRHPLLNLLVQGWLTTMAALLTPFLVARYLSRGVGAWMETGVLVNVGLLIFAWRVVQLDWFVTQPYALSISLAFAALIVVERAGVPRLAIGTALMVLAHWVNVGVFLLVIPATVLVRRLCPRSLAVAAAGMAGGLAFAALSSGERTPTAFMPIRAWPEGWLQLLWQVTGGALDYQIWLVVLVSVALAAAGVIAWRRQYALLVPAGSAGVLAVWYWLAVGTSKWVAMNLYSPRYVYPSLFFLGVAVVWLVVSATSTRYRLGPVTWLAFLVAVGAVYGAPSPDRLRHHFDERFGSLTSQTLAEGARVIAGSYWTVWPWVFHANLVLYQQRPGTLVYGLTHRSMETDPFWCTSGNALVIAASQDREVRGYADRIGLPLAPLRDGPSVRTFTSGRCRALP